MSANKPPSFLNDDQRELYKNIFEDVSSNPVFKQEEVAVETNRRFEEVLKAEAAAPLTFGR